MQEVTYTLDDQYYYYLINSGDSIHYNNTFHLQSSFLIIMNTTILYSFPDDLKYRYMSFNTYEQALKAIELFTQINVKAEVKV